MNYDLYHLEYDNDRQAMSAIDRLHPRTRLAGGVVWPSLNHGIGETSYLVLALPAGTQSDLTNGQPVHSTVSSTELVGLIEDELTKTEERIGDDEEGDELFEANDGVLEEDDDE